MEDNNAEDVRLANNGVVGLFGTNGEKLDDVVVLVLPIVPLLLLFVLLRTVKLVGLGLLFITVGGLNGLFCLANANLSL